MSNYTGLPDYKRRICQQCGEGLSFSSTRCDFCDEEYKNQEDHNDQGTDRNAAGTNGGVRPEVDGDRSVY